MKIPALPGFEQAAFQKYVKNTGWLLAGKLLSLVVGFIIARYLGPYAFGDLSFADAFADGTLVRVAVNMEHVQISHPLNDADEVAFFPPVTGG